MPYAKAASTKIVVYDVGRVLSEKVNDDYLVEELRAALSNNELTCYYQPKIRADWHHPSRGLLLPEEEDLSVDELELDRVVVSRLAEDPRSIAIEDDATLGALRRYGCQEAIWRCTRSLGNLAFTRRGVEQLGSSLGS